MNFNSHAHVERDIETSSFYDGENISTHTLTWSVTFCRFCYLLYLNYFNSHAHVERDEYNKNCIDEINNFNSHAHVERDLI